MGTDEESKKRVWQPINNKEREGVYSHLGFSWTEIIESAFINITHCKMALLTLRGKIKVNIQWLLYLSGKPREPQVENQDNVCYLAFNILR
jgi:hypothetical protein